MRPFYVLVLLVGFLPAAAFAALPPQNAVTGQVQAPDPCERGINWQAMVCQPRMDQRQFFYQTDSVCAASRIGVTAYTSQITIFNDFKCASGYCNNGVPGIAHRTWPLGSKVEVCDLKSGVCAVAVVMDRGPNVCLTQRTIDANPALARELHLTGLDQATYRLLSVPGIAQTAQPSGPTRVSLEAIQAANAAYNPGGVMPNNMGYTQVQTPYGVGYLGTPGGGVPASYIPYSQIGQINGQPMQIMNPQQYVNGGYGYPSGQMVQTPWGMGAVQTAPGGMYGSQYQYPYNYPAYGYPQQAQDPYYQLGQMIGQAIKGDDTSSSGSGAALTTQTQSYTGTNDSTFSSYTAPTQAQPVFSPVSIIVVNPSHIQAGDTVSVSWSSVGMSASQKCKMFKGDGQLSEGNQGTSNTKITGHTTFTLYCLSSAGSPVQTSASVL